MTKKQIIVSGCHDCDYATAKYLFNEMPCWEIVNISEMKKCREFRKLHPDCPLDDYKELEIGKYYELLHYVETKYPDESRHDTALRYIKEAEKRGGGGLANEQESNS